MSPPERHDPPNHGCFYFFLFLLFIAFGVLVVYGVSMGSSLPGEVSHGERGFRADEKVKSDVP
jgi:hypothetical protein